MLNRLGYNPERPINYNSLIKTLSTHSITGLTHAVLTDTTQRQVQIKNLLNTFETLIAQLALIFLKKAVIQKIEVGITSNLLQSISTCISICIIKIWGDSGVIFWKKPWTIAFAFLKICYF